MKDFDLAKLFNSMKENDINELIIKEGSKLYEIRRGGIKHNIISETNKNIQANPHLSTAIPQSIQNQQQMPVSISSQEQGVETKSEEKNSNLYELKSPLVGTFYSSSKPDAPSFVDVGDKVSKGQTVCIVEAMKNFNEIESEVDGIIEEICVKNTELVEFGKVLFRIKLS
jgi:acetyl-CoA carboxylase biotin carboxyl carrier protein